MYLNFKVFKTLKAAKAEDGQWLHKDIKLTFNGEGTKLHPTLKPVYLYTILDKFTSYLPQNMQKPKYILDT